MRSKSLVGISRIPEFALLFCLLVFPCQFSHGDGSDQGGDVHGHWARDLDERSARLERLTWERFTEVTKSAGISSKFVYVFDQDDQGFIWMGTRNGLDRYDGYSVINYRHEPDVENSLASSDIRTIAAASNGVIWAGSHAAGLDRFNSALGTAVNFRNNPGDPHDIGDDHVNQVVIDNTGDIWVATQNAGLSHINHRTLEVTRFHTAAGGKMKIPSDEVRIILADHADRIWAVTGNGLVFSEDTVPEFEPVILKIDGMADPPVIQTMQQASDGTLYMVTADNHVLQVRRAENSKETDVKDISITQPLSEMRPASILLIDLHGRLWIDGAANGYGVYDPVIKKAVNKLGGDHIAAFEDRTGTIWISSNPGVYRLDPDILMFGDLVQEVNSRGEDAVSHVFAIWETKDTSVFFSDTEGVWKYQPGVRDLQAFAIDISDAESPNDTNALYQDQTGIFWAGTNISGINRIDPDSGAIRKYQLCDAGADTEICDQVWALQGDSIGNLWVGTAQDLLSYDSASDSFNSVSLPEGFVRNMVSSGVRTLENGDGNVLWMGTEQGLLRWQKDTNDWQRFVHEPNNANSLSSNYINALHEDDEGVLWIGTQLGAHRLDPVTGEFRRFDTGTGLPNDDIHSLIEDVYGTIWMSTGEGLVSINKVSFEINVYNEANGLTNDEFLLAAGHAGSSGKVYFGANNNLVYFDPAKLTINNIPPQVALTEMRINNVRVSPDASDPTALLRTSINLTDSIELPHQQASFSVDFAAMHYANPKQNQYAYRLLGFNDNWTYTDSSHRTASYTRLPYGNYTLQVKAANNDGIWNEVMRNLKVTVLTPMWATWWAYLIYSFLIVAIVFLLIQLRTRALLGQANQLEQLVQERTSQIKENEQLISSQAENMEKLLHLKEKLFTNISHEFRTPLTLILGPVNRMLKSDITDEQTSRLQMVKQNSQRLLRLVDQLLTLSRLEAEEPIELSPQAITKIVAAIGESFAPLARSRDITFEVEVDDDLWVNATADALERILMNLLSNAFKYTPRGGNVNMTLVSGDANRVELTISDSGVGIAPERQESVFDRFNRVVDASESIPGAGIGLSLVSEIVEALDGSIRLVSERGEGTAMTVALPGIDAPLSPTKDEPDIVLSESSNMELDNLSRSGYVTGESSDLDEQPGTTILVIEDNPDMQEYLVELLAPHYSCLLAGDGQLGMEIGLEQVPDLILCDVMLPKKDGYEVSQILKTDVRSSHIPIIMLTARGDHQSRLKGLREKVDDYVAKPFDDEELLLRIGNLLEVRETVRRRFSSGFFSNGNFGHGLNKRDRAFLVKLDAILENNYSDSNFRIDDLSSQMAMSERNLQRKLKAVTDRSPGQYLRSYRLKIALVLLREGTVVNLVAEQVGFSSPAYFSSCFRQEFKQSPSTFTNNI